MPLKTFHGKRVGQGKGNGVKSGPQTDSSGISFCAETGSFRVPTPFPLEKVLLPPHKPRQQPYTRNKPLTRQPKQEPSPTKSPPKPSTTAQLLRKHSVEGENGDNRETPAAGLVYTVLTGFTIRELAAARGC